MEISKLDMPTGWQLVAIREIREKYGEIFGTLKSS